MAGSTWGTLLTMTTWGESHGKGVGVVVDGCPAGLALCEEDIQTYLNRRKPGQSRFTTMRQESDQVEILSGVFEGKTTGTPISLLVRNTDQRSHDYSSIMDIYRPGHADYTFDEMLPALFMSFLLASFQRQQSLCVTAALAGALGGILLFSIPAAILAGIVCGCLTALLQAMLKGMPDEQ